MGFFSLSGLHRNRVWSSDPVTRSSPWQLFATESYLQIWYFKSRSWESIISFHLFFALSFRSFPFRASCLSTPPPNFEGSNAPVLYIWEIE